MATMAMRRVRQHQSCRRSPSRGAGHDFLDAVRDPEIWVRTRKGAEHVKGFTLDLLKDLAKGFLKKQLEEYTGVRL